MIFCKLLANFTRGAKIDYLYVDTAVLTILFCIALNFAELLANPSSQPIGLQSRLFNQALPTMQATKLRQQLNLSKRD